MDSPGGSPWSLPRRRGRLGRERPGPIAQASAAGRRQLTLLIAAVGVAVSILVASFVPVPYVILSPGPTLNTLGSLGTHSDAKPLIQITGTRTYPTSGHLNLVTVSYQGGPGDSFNIFTALQAWLSPHEAVVPEQELFPTGQTPQQVTHQDTEQMVNSQQACGRSKSARWPVRCITSRCWRRAAMCHLAKRGHSGTRCGRSPG